MTNTNYSEISNSDDCEKYVNQFIQNFQIRSAEIGKGTVIKRALPSRHKRMIGAWCFLDHAGPVSFPQGDGLDVGPHPHIGLQTFTWMIEGTMLHSDSLGTTNQLIRPKQVNLMTAGHGISHTEVACMRLSFGLLYLMIKSIWHRNLIIILNCLWLNKMVSNLQF